MSLGSQAGKREVGGRKERKKEGKERNRMILFNTPFKETELTCWSLETLVSRCRRELETDNCL